MSDAQLALYQWARWYDSIYKMSPTDKPEDRIINNDVELDKWFERYLTDSARKLAGKASRRDQQRATEEPAQAFKVFE